MCPLRLQIRCVRKSQGGQAAASGRSSAIHTYVGRKAKPTLPTTASAVHLHLAIDHEQAPNCPPTPRSFVPRVDLPSPGLLVLLEPHTAAAAALQTTAASFLLLSRQRRPTARGRPLTR